MTRTVRILRGQVMSDQMDKSIIINFLNYDEPKLVNLFHKNLNFDKTIPRMSLSNYTQESQKEDIHFPKNLLVLGDWIAH